METNDKKLPVIATLTDEERKIINDNAEQVRALELQTAQMMRELHTQLTERRRAVLVAQRETWAVIEKKYSLDPRKAYELVQSTGELVEHVHHQGLVMVDLTDIFKGAPGAEATPPRKLNS